MGDAIEHTRRLEERLRLLEGEYFVFQFSGGWLEGRGYALAVLQMKSGQFVDAYHPCDHDEWAIGERQDEEALQFLQGADAREVYSFTAPWFPQTVLGKVFRQVPADDGEEAESGYAYAVLSKHYWEHALGERGIILKIIE